jgi:hypothetical protein
MINQSKDAQVLMYRHLLGQYEHLWIRGHTKFIRRWFPRVYLMLVTFIERHLHRIKLLSPQLPHSIEPGKAK